MKNRYVTYYLFSNFVLIQTFNLVAPKPLNVKLTCEMKLVKFVINQSSITCRVLNFLISHPVPEASML